jgi:DNA-binding CsgD family transcriptional regulator
MTHKHQGCPGWLGLTEDRTAFVFFPERAEVVRKIFEMSASGLGGYTIAKKLNAEGVPGFGQSGKWDQSTIHNMLRNRATLGEYQKKRKLNGKEALIGEPVPNYYPAVIDEDLFRAAQEARVENLTYGRGRKGNDIANLFDRIANCSYCKKPLRFHSDGGAKSLICSAVLEIQGCHRFRWTYRDFELSFLAVAKQHGLSRLQEAIAKLERASENDVYAHRIELMLALRKNVSGLSVAMAGTSPPQNATPAPIGRDHPRRFFEVDFSGGSRQTGFPLPPPAPDRVIQLKPVQLIEAFTISPRQAALIASLASGRSLSQSAEHLGMALSTARWHLRIIFERTNVHSQADLIERACSVGSARG